MQRTNSPIWLSPPGALDLSPRQVDIWRARLGLSPAVFRMLETTLSDDERERAARFHFPADRERFIAAHGCLRDILARYLDCQPADLAFSANPNGKPTLRDHTLEFNLSHSGELAAIAIARERKVGIDVERIRSGISSFVIARQYFSKSEVAELETLSLEQRETAFFICWTRKEAYIKARGLGLSLPLESFDVSLIPGEPAILRATRPDPQEAARWTLFSLRVDPDYECAVAVEGTDPEFRLWDWSADYSVTAS